MLIFLFPSFIIVHSGYGRLAQLVRAPARQAGGRRFESNTAHHGGISAPSKNPEFIKLRGFSLYSAAPSLPRETSIQLQFTEALKALFLLTIGINSYMIYFAGFL